jgi:transcriptional regulator with XRE-family HTH domain
MEEHEYLKTLGNRIRLLRNDQKMSQTELSHRANVERGSMNKIEKGLINVTLSTLVKISEALEVRVKDLIEF